MSKRWIWQEIELWIWRDVKLLNFDKISNFVTQTWELNLLIVNEAGEHQNFFCFNWYYLKWPEISARLSVSATATSWKFSRYDSGIYWLLFISNFLDNDTSHQLDVGCWNTPICRTLVLVCLPIQLARKRSVVNLADNELRYKLVTTRSPYGFFGFDNSCYLGCEVSLWTMTFVVNASLVNNLYRWSAISQARQVKIYRGNVISALITKPVAVEIKERLYTSKSNCYLKSSLPEFDWNMADTVH